MATMLSGFVKVVTTCAMIAENRWFRFLFEAWTPFKGGCGGSAPTGQRTQKLLWVHGYIASGYGYGYMFDSVPSLQP